MLPPAAAGDSGEGKTRLSRFGLGERECATERKDMLKNMHRSSVLTEAAGVPRSVVLFLMSGPRPGTSWYHCGVFFSFVSFLSIFYCMAAYFPPKTSSTSALTRWARSTTVLAIYHISMWPSVGYVYVVAPVPNPPQKERDVNSSLSRYYSWLRGVGRTCLKTNQCFPMFLPPSPFSPPPKVPSPSLGEPDLSIAICTHPPVCNQPFGISYPGQNCSSSWKLAPPPKEVHTACIVPPGNHSPHPQKYNTYRLLKTGVGWDV